ncbi:hypothetical protein JCM3774_005378 [Rhodotorula dairenensis]
MASFADLPAELLTIIFRFACDAGGAAQSRTRTRHVHDRLPAAARASLASFSLVHSAWSLPAQEILLGYVSIHCGFDPGASGTMADLERACRLPPSPSRRPFALAIRTIKFTGQGNHSTDHKMQPVVPYCDENLLSLCPNLVALCIDRSVAFDWSAIATMSERLRSLEILTPSFKLASESPPVPAFPRLINLTISPYELHRVLRQVSDRLRAPRDASAATRIRTPTFASLTTINFTSHTASDHVYLDEYGTTQPSQRRRRVPYNHGVMLPRLGALTCPVALRHELEQLGSLTTRLRDRTLWHVGWQDFVDYMPPWRTFALDPDGLDDDDHDGSGEDQPRPKSRSSRLCHLYIRPLPYDPLPRHFLDELTRRIQSDPSLHALCRLYLPTKGWAPLVLVQLPRLGAGARNGLDADSTEADLLQRSLAFTRVCEKKGVSLSWVEAGGETEGGNEVLLMPEEYRIRALAEEPSGRSDG